MLLIKYYYITQTHVKVYQWRSQPDNLVMLYVNFKSLSLYISLEIDFFHGL